MLTKANWSPVHLDRGFCLIMEFCWRRKSWAIYCKGLDWLAGAGTLVSWQAIFPVFIILIIKACYLDLITNKSTLMLYQGLVHANLEDTLHCSTMSHHNNPHHNNRMPQFSICVQNEKGLQIYFIQIYGTAVLVHTTEEYIHNIRRYL